MLGRREFEHINVLNDNKYIIINLQALTFNSSTQQKCVTNFVFSQFSGPQPWYVLFHSDDDVENNLACVVLYYGIPEGNDSLLRADVYVIRCVHNIHCLFTANCGGKSI